MGAEIARIRKAQDLTQAGLSDKSGVGVRTISDIETGRKIARVGTMRKLEAALGLKAGATDDMLEGKRGKMVSREPAPTGTQTVTTVSRSELFTVAALIEDVDGTAAAEAWMQRALAKRAAATETSDED